MLAWFDERLAGARVPRLLLQGAVAYGATAVTLHLTWIATGQSGWIVAFQAATAAFLFTVAALGAVQTVSARAFFLSRDRLRPVWTLLLAAAVCRWGGHAVTSFGPAILAGPLASLAAMPGVAVLFPADVPQLGRVVAGPVSMALMAAALGGVVVLYRRLGLLVRPTGVDLVLVAAVGLFAAQFVRDLVGWREQLASSATLLDAASWTSDPLLALLLLEAILIRRAALHMGAGYISRCWSALAAGILLMSIGDMGLWAVAREYITWPWTSLFWYAWPPAEVAFALAPAWQVIASQQAQTFAERSGIGSQPAGRPPDAPPESRSFGVLDRSASPRWG